MLTLRNGRSRVDAFICHRADVHSVATQIREWDVTLQEICEESSILYRFLSRERNVDT